VSQLLAVLNLGMVSCLSDSTEANASIMRIGYSNALPSEFYPSGNDEAYLASMAQFSGEASNHFMGLARWVELAGIAAAEALQGRIEKLPDILVVACFPSASQNTDSLNASIKTNFLARLVESLGAKQAGNRSSFSMSDRISFVNGLQQARERIYQDGFNHVLLIAVDSLLNQHRMNLYEGWSDLPRLFTEENSNGFIPGEAAVALLLGKPDGTEQTCITGIGFGEEPAPINSGEILRANGLSEAIRNAAADAGIRVCDTDFRISSANGEEYWFKEASLAQSRTLEEKRESHPLWHPADHIGEVGAAVGGAMVVMAHYAFEKGYAPGKRALCQLSNDDQHRAAFILERTESS
jgi:3-oxoacyl-[acyl-carrier-protein] synthase-1